MLGSSEIDASVWAAGDRTPDGLRATVRDLVLAHGYNSNDVLALYDGWQYYVSAAPRGVVMYVERAGYLVAGGDPICAADDLAALLDGFVAFAAHRGLRVAFLGASARLAALAVADGFGAVKVGEEPFFDLVTWGPRGDRAKKVRSAMNQARRTGVTVTTYTPGTTPDAVIEQAATDLCRRWQSTRPAGQQMGFSLTLQPFVGREFKRYVLAWYEGRLVGLLACSPLTARRGYYLEDVIRAPDAPTGTTELLVTTAMAALKEAGAEVATLGVAPLAGVESQPHGPHRGVARLLTFAREHLNQAYNFKSLNHYKRKYAPTTWEETYLIYHARRITPRLVWALITAFMPDSPTRALRAAAIQQVRTRRRSLPRPRRALALARSATCQPATLALLLLAGSVSTLGRHTAAGGQQLPLLHLHLWLVLTILIGAAALLRGHAGVRTATGAQA